MERSIGIPRARSVVGVRGPRVSTFGLPATRAIASTLVGVIILPLSTGKKFSGSQVSKHICLHGKELVISL